MSNDTFAERLRDSMDRRNIKQVDLIRIAQEQGVKLGKSHMSQYVSGKTIPRPDMIRFLAGALSVEENWLAGAETAVPETAPREEEEVTETKTETAGDRKSVV